MNIKKFIHKIDHIQTAIEANEIMVNDYGYECLKPTLNFLKEQKQDTAAALANHKEVLNIELKQHEIVTRLSHI